METVLEALQAMEKASAIEIAARTGIGRDEVVNELWDLKNQGKVEQHGRSWRVAVPFTPDPKPALDEKTTAEIVEAIPAFTSRPDDLAIPSTRFISSEIRRTKAKLANLEKLRDAVRSIRKHGALMQELAQ